MQELRGMPVVKQIAADAALQVEELKKKGIEPKLAVVRVGEREDDLSYERGLLKRFDAVGALVESVVFPMDVTQEELEAGIKKLNEDDKVHGILVFRPLPKHLDEEVIKEMVTEMKDVDCMGSANTAHVFAQDGKGHAPCTPQAVIEMLDFYGYDLTGKKAVVVGRSMVVGKPLAQMLLKKNATVTICHTKTADLRAEVKSADFVFACAGVAKMLDASYISEGQVVIDVGINRTADGKLCGDVDFEAVKDLAGFITPVPGGCGPMTVAMLMANTLKAAKLQMQSK